MAVFDRQQEKIVARVVYDGPAGAGKTTNLSQLCRFFTKLRRSELVAPAEAAGRTLFFDWLQLDGGLVGGVPLRCHLLTVPGQAVLAHRRLHLLASADVIVFVCDSTTSGVDMGRRMLESLRSRQADSASLPMVVQANKQDGPGCLTPGQVLAGLGLASSVPVVPARAHDGQGLRETLVLAIRAAANAIQARILEHGLTSLEGQAEGWTELYQDMQARDEAMQTGQSAASTVWANLDAPAAVEPGLREQDRVRVGAVAAAPVAAPAPWPTATAASGASAAPLPAVEPAPAVARVAPVAPPTETQPAPTPGAGAAAQLRPDVTLPEAAPAPAARLVAPAPAVARVAPVAPPTETQPAPTPGAGAAAQPRPDVTQPEAAPAPAARLVVPAVPTADAGSLPGPDVEPVALPSTGMPAAAAAAPAPVATPTAPAEPLAQTALVPSPGVLSAAPPAAIPGLGVPTSMAAPAPVATPVAPSTTTALPSNAASLSPPALPVLHQDVARPARAHAPSDAEPTLPHSDVPIGFVWPASPGRDILRAIPRDQAVRRDDLVGQHGRSDGSGTSDARIYKAGDWCLKSSIRRRFADVDDARQAMLQLARRKIALGELLPPRTVLCLTPAGDGSVWLWTITPWLTTLRGWMERSEQLQDEATLELALCAFADAAVQALQVASQLRVTLDVHPSNFALAEGRLVYLDDDIGGGAHLPALGHALLRRADEYVHWPRAVDGYVKGLEHNLGMATRDIDELTRRDLVAALESALVVSPAATAARARLLAALGQGR